MIDAHRAVALYRIVLWLALAFVTWRVGLRAYPTMRAIMTVNAIVYAVMGVSALVHGLMPNPVSDTWFVLAVTPILTAAAVMSAAVMLAKPWDK